MNKRLIAAAIVCGFTVIFLCLRPGGLAFGAGTQVISFTNAVEPILRNQCWTCHGETMQLSKLDLRNRESAIKGGNNGAALVPGSAEQSRLYRRIAGLENPRMPLDGQLSAEQISTIKAWIDQGAHWEDSAATPAGSSAVSSNALAALENM